MAETGAEILARIQPRLDEDWTEICLRPDLVAEYEELSDKLEQAQFKPGPKRNADGTTRESKALAKQVEAVRAQIGESAVKFVFRGLARDKFRALCDEHPPNRKDQMDMVVGYDRAALGDSLVHASLVEPAFDADSWKTLLDSISIGEWNELRRCAEKVNGSVVTESPKAGLASRILSSPGRGSKPQPDSA